MKPHFLALVVGATLLLIGCDQAADNEAPVEVVDLGGSSISQTASDNAGQEATPSAATPAMEVSDAADVSPNQVNGGQFLLKAGEGRVSLHADQASRISILEDFAGRAGFELDVESVPDKLVSVDLNDADAGTVLAALFADTAFLVSYRAQAQENGFRLQRVRAGQDQYREMSLTVPGAKVGLGNYEPGDSPIFLGSDPEDVDLVQRLLGGSVEDRVDAINEMVIDPAGLNAAYQVYRSDSSAEVRLAIIEVMEGEDTFGAKQLLIEALDDASPEVVLYALGIVDSNSDFTLLPKVQALMQHPDPEVAEYARDVEESIRLSYDELE